MLRRMLPRVAQSSGSRAVIGRASSSLRPPAGRSLTTVAMGSVAVGAAVWPTAKRRPHCQEQPLGAAHKRHWDGEGECPIQDPFDKGMDELDSAIRYAERTQDYHALARIIDFIVRHMFDHYYPARAYLEIHHASGYFRPPQRFALMYPKDILMCRYNDATLPSRRGGPPSTRLWHFMISENVTCCITFVDERASAPMYWTIHFSPKPRASD